MGINSKVASLAQCRDYGAGISWCRYVVKFYVRINVEVTKTASLTRGIFSHQASLALEVTAGEEVTNFPITRTISENVNTTEVHITLTSSYSNSTSLKMLHFRVSSCAKVIGHRLRMAVSCLKSVMNNHKNKRHNKHEGCV